MMQPLIKPRTIHCRPIARDACTATCNHHPEQPALLLTCMCIAKSKDGSSAPCRVGVQRKTRAHASFLLDRRPRARLSGFCWDRRPRRGRRWWRARGWGGPAGDAVVRADCARGGAAARNLPMDGGSRFTRGGDVNRDGFVSDG